MFFSDWIITFGLPPEEMMWIVLKLGAFLWVLDLVVCILLFILIEIYCFIADGKARYPRPVFWRIATGILPLEDRGCLAPVVFFIWLWFTMIPAFFVILFLVFWYVVLLGSLFLLWLFAIRALVRYVKQIKDMGVK